MGKPPPSHLQTTVQTVSAVVMALAAVFAVIATSKEKPQIAWALIALAVVTVFLTFCARVFRFFQERRIRELRDESAIVRYQELLRFARRFAQFTRSTDSSNIRPMIFSLCGNDPEKCSEVCPPDYMNELFLHFLQNLEARPPENESHFLLSARQLYGLVASYNFNYVCEPFRVMRLNRWIQFGANLESYNRGESPTLGPWMETLGVLQRAHAGRQIEDFRERWVVFIDAFREWLQNINEDFGASLHVYLERPQKL